MTVGVAGKRRASHLWRRCHGANVRHGGERRCDRRRWRRHHRRRSQARRWRHRLIGRSGSAGVAVFSCNTQTRQAAAARRRAARRRAARRRRRSSPRR